MKQALIKIIKTAMIIYFTVAYCVIACVYMLLMAFAFIPVLLTSLLLFENPTKYASLFIELYYNVIESAEDVLFEIKELWKRNGE